MWLSGGTWQLPGRSKNVLRGQGKKADSAFTVARTWTRAYTVRTCLLCQRRKHFSISVPGGEAEGTAEVGPESCPLSNIHNEVRLV